MPSFAKKSLSLFLRSDCQRQFRLSLYLNSERDQLGMPLAQQARSNVGLVGAAGDIYQDAKVSEISTIFGSANVLCGPKLPNKTRPKEILLLSVIDHLKPHQFVVEADFEVVDAFKQDFGLDKLQDEFGVKLDFSNLRPDALQVLPSLASAPGGHATAVKPDGALIDLDPTDSRLRLRVIDVKLASEPGANYFAEVVYYSMALSAWLEHHGKDGAFVVLSNGAVWPGKYEKSALSLKFDEGQRGIAVGVDALMAAMEEDLEPAEFSVYVPRLVRLLRVQLPQMLKADWGSLPWHPDFRCQSCEFLGYPWVDKYGKPTQHPLHCWQLAEKGDLVSRVAGLSRTGAVALRSKATTVSGLAGLSASDPIFTAHANLRSKGAALRARARSLTTGVAGGVAGSGASATIPTWADLKIFITLDYDPSSAITCVMSMRASWREPAPYGVDREHAKKSWGDKKNGVIINVVPSCTPDDEKRELIHFLKQLKGIMDEVRSLDDMRIQTAKAAGQTDEPPSTYQIYLWDDAQFRHLKRLMGRHLAIITSNPDLKGLAWLFPPSEILPLAEDATRASPVSLVCGAVDSHVAVPVPHYYTLYEVAQHYLVPGRTPPIIDPLFREPLTNLIPAERIHEFWSHKDDWPRTLDILRETSTYKTLALSLVTDQLGRDPNVQLAKSAAPPLSRTYNTLANATPESLLWYGFTRLDAELSRVEAEMIYTLPPEEREARFHSAHLVRRLATSQEINDALQKLSSASGITLSPGSGLFIYTVSQFSRDVKMQVGSFTLALSPRNEDLFLNKQVERRLPNAINYGAQAIKKNIGSNKLTRVSIAAIDRDNLLIALRPDNASRILQMEATGDADFSRDVMLDEVFDEFLVKKVRLSLEGIGKPKNYTGNPTILSALGAGSVTLKNAKDTPAHDFLYFAPKTSTQLVSRPVSALRRALESDGLHLNSSQWHAWEMSLTRRLSVIWGPPGTGKSETLRAICRGAVLHAQNANEPLRLLVTANTYTAVDNVLCKLEQHFRGQNGVRIFRVQSSTRPVNTALASYPSLANIILSRHNPTQEAVDLRVLLLSPGQNDIIIVGAPAQQIHNLAFAGEKSDSAGHAKKLWFDLVVLDEASQVDAATSSLIFSKVSEGGSCVLAGDDKQLPPIHQADAPKGLETAVGSVYSFMTGYHGIDPNSLDVNYRSNSTIVEFIKCAGYPPALSAHSPDLKLHLPGGLPTNAPIGWPSVLPFIPGWAELLDPDTPLTCYIYDDVTSGQSNEFEAQAVAALLRLLWGRIATPKNRRDINGSLEIASTQFYDTPIFWGKCIGVVAPHRSQGSKIVDTLQRTFANTGTMPNMIRDAVDTVERFQGQERDVIVASFGLGDPDVIASEDEFLFDLNRFNVLASRACTKVVVLLTRSLLDHLSDDQDVVRASRLLKHYAELTCGNERPLTLEYLDSNSVQRRVTGVLRTR